MNARLAEILAVGAAGSVGAVCRLLVGRGVQRLAAVPFPVGTLVVNVSGCLLLGWFTTYAHRRGLFSDAVRSAVTIGFVGAYTTFSTWAFDVDGLWHGGRGGRAVLNLIASIVLGLLAVRAGVLLGSGD